MSFGTKVHFVGLQIMAEEGKEQVELLKGFQGMMTPGGCSWNGFFI